MPPETGTSLLILVAFALPGFVTVLLKERTHEAGREVSQFERVLQTGYYSVWSYLLLALFTIVIGLDRHDLEHLYNENRGNPTELIWRGALAIVVPSFLVANSSRLWERWRFRVWLYRKVGVNTRHRVPTAWDCFFAQRSRAMVLATLRDGRVVGGYYGRDSFAAYSKDGRDLYLEQRWTLSDANWFDAPSNDTLGVWLSTEEVVSLELYRVNDDDDAKEAESTGQSTEEGLRGASGTDGSRETPK